MSLFFKFNNLIEKSIKRRVVLCYQQIIVRMSENITQQYTFTIAGHVKHIVFLACMNRLMLKIILRNSPLNGTIYSIPKISLGRQISLLIFLYFLVLN